jgi:hypothetical protein
VVHGDPNNPDNIRMTADRVALIDWDESHVDVPDLDLALPHNAAGLDGRAHDIAAQASATWEAGTTSTQSSGLPKFERSERYWDTQPPDRHADVAGAQREFTLLSAVAQQLPSHLGQHVADLIEQLVRSAERTIGFGAAPRLPASLFPIRDACQHAGDVRD